MAVSTAATILLAKRETSVISKFSFSLSPRFYDKPVSIMREETEIWAK